VSYLIMMDLDRWDGLDEETQTLLLEAGHQLERDSIGVFDALLVEETAAMVEAGAQTTSIGYTLDEANALFAERAMEVAIEASGADGEAFRDFVAEQGM
jgi:TRAP-type C4-dicarboxylate transport system substrate-binding protein